MKRLLTEIDEWYRRRLRIIVWKQWKRTKTNLDLIKPGVKRYQSMRMGEHKERLLPYCQQLFLTTSVTNVSVKQVIFLIGLLSKGTCCLLRKRSVPERYAGWYERSAKL